MHNLPGLGSAALDNDGHVLPAANVVIDDPTGLSSVQGLDGTSPPPLMDDDYWARLPDPLPVSAVADVVRLSKGTVSRRLNTGEIPGYFIGGSWILFKDEFRAWLGSMRNDPIPPPEDVDPLRAFDDNLGVADLMEIFGKGKLTILRWLHNRTIPGYLVSNRWIVYKSELRATLASTSNEPRPE
ncbi:MAG: helix-turn-helix domain-containing protein [Pseudolysinimonas sp.]|uniref:helix-turn-helix domain-containing protein n=1 Tax=Pseudolysinimonas sp. TaxID=2680009 RepID=UPI0032655D58